MFLAQWLVFSLLVGCFSILIGFLRLNEAIPTYVEVKEAVTMAADLAKEKLKLERRLQFYNITGKKVQEEITRLELEMLLTEEKTVQSTFTAQEESDIMISRDEPTNKRRNLTIMAKNKPVAAPTKAKEVTTVKIADIAAKYELEPRQLRAFIRTLGIRAPEVKQEGFGPRARYEWLSDSKELKQIIDALEAKLSDEDAEAEGVEEEVEEVEETEDKEEEVEAPPAKKRRK